MNRQQQIQRLKQNSNLDRPTTSFFGDVSVAQLVASMSGVVLGGVVEVVGSNLARGKIFTASIGSVDSLYPSIYILKRKSFATV